MASWDIFDPQKIQTLIDISRLKSIDDLQILPQCYLEEGQSNGMHFGKTYFYMFSLKTMLARTDFRVKGKQYI